MHVWNGEKSERKNSGCILKHQQIDKKLVKKIKIKINIVYSIFKCVDFFRPGKFLTKKSIIPNVSH